MLNLTCYAHAQGNAIFFDARRESNGGTSNSFEFTPYMDSRLTLHWTLNILTNAYQPSKRREDLSDTEFNLAKLAFVGFERVRAFAIPDSGSLGVRNGLAHAVVRAYRSAESGVLESDGEAIEVVENLARFYRRAKGLPDLWPSTMPLPDNLRLFEGAVTQSAYDF